MITKETNPKVQARKHLIQILYAALESKGHFKTIIQIEPLTEEEILNVIDHYLN